MQIRHRMQSGTIGIRNKINNMATRNIYIVLKTIHAPTGYMHYIHVHLYTNVIKLFSFQYTSFFDLEHHITFSPQNL